MAGDSVEQGDPRPGRSGQIPRDGGQDEAGRAADRRRIIITGLLTPPAVMTLNARSARAQASVHPSMDPNYGKAAPGKAAPAKTGN
jgi:hypothetical protein